MLKKRCSRSENHPVIKWGKTSSGAQRYYCSVCKKAFCWKRPDNRLSSRYSWFLLWLRGTPVNIISELKHKSPDVIFEAIDYFLSRPPKPSPISNPNCYPVIDATWFGRKNCLLAYWDKNLEKIQWWRWSDKKEAAWEIIEDLENLKKNKVIFKGATTDGGPGIKKALDFIYPHIPHQRCLVHLQRMALIYITQRPKTLAGLELRNIALKINGVKTHEQHYLWQKEFYSWCHSHYRFLKEKTLAPDLKHWWYTHRGLRRVRRMIINALPNMWHYLNDKNISKDTNGLEGRWNSLKTHFRNHRGLLKDKREAYFPWYLTAVVNKEIPTL